MENISITNARKELFQLAEKTAQYGTPIRILSKKGDVVMISAADWEAIQETLLLNSNKEVRESILEAMQAQPEDFVEDIGWDIN